MRTLRIVTSIIFVSISGITYSQGIFDPYEVEGNVRLVKHYIHKSGDASQSFLTAKEKYEDGRIVEFIPLISNKQDEYKEYEYKLSGDTVYVYSIDKSKKSKLISKEYSIGNQITYREEYFKGSNYEQTTIFDNIEYENDNIVFYRSRIYPNNGKRYHSEEVDVIRYNDSISVDRYSYGGTSKGGEKYYLDKHGDPVESYSYRLIEEDGLEKVKRRNRIYYVFDTEGNWIEKYVKNRQGEVELYESRKIYYRF